MLVFLEEDAAKSDSTAVFMIRASPRPRKDKLGFVSADKGISVQPYLQDMQAQPLPAMERCSPTLGHWHECFYG